MIEEIELGGQTHKIEVKPITLIFKSAEIIEDVKYKDRFPIGLAESIYHIERVKKLHEKTLYFLIKAMPFTKELQNLPWDEVSAKINQMGTGVKHLAGRLDLTLKLIDKVPIAWVYPEAALHPSVQTELADILIELTKEK